MKSASRLKLVATVATVVKTSTRPGAPALTDRAQAVPRLVRATLDGTYAGTTRRRLALVAAAVAYVVSPLDLLPEAVLPVLGAADDAVVLTWAIKAFMEETERFLAWEAGQGVRQGPQAPDGGATAPLGSTGWRSVPSGPVTRRATGAGPHDRLRSEVREAATNYVLESVRKRLER